MTTRREFLGAGAALLAAPSLRGLPARAPADEPLEILFLGGTGFIGPHQIEFALERGHKVTMFNRGRRAGLYAGQVEELVGDRDASSGDGLQALEGDRKWDVVIDNSGYVPRHVRDSAELLKDRCGRYLYVSTVAVYDYDQTEDGVCDHNGPLYAALEPATEEVTGATYGPLKAECDRIVRQVYGERATVVRPCYIVGPGDSTNRFTYWIERFHRGGDIVCPAGPGNEVQWIDVRDLCHWLVRLAEGDVPGTFNATGPASAVTNEQLVWALRSFTAAPIQLHWPSAELLDELDYTTPMFDPARGDRHADASASWAAGLSYRPLAETVRDTHIWWLSEPAERRADPPRWPTAEQEQAVLARLRR